MYVRVYCSYISRYICSGNCKHCFRFIVRNWCACWANTASNCHSALRWADNDEDDDALMTMMPRHRRRQLSWAAELRSWDSNSQTDRETDSRAVQPISHQIRLTSCSLLPLLLLFPTRFRLWLGLWLAFKSSWPRGVRRKGGESFPYFVLLLPTDFVYTDSAAKEMYSLPYSHSYSWLYSWLYSCIRLLTRQRGELRLLGCEARRIPLPNCSKNRMI